MKRAAIERLLPGVYQASLMPGTPLAAILDVMEALHEPDERVLADVDHYFDPYLAPPGFVSFLARWVDVDWLLGDGGTPGSGSFLAGLGHLRNVVARAADLSARRGTADGLRAFLETATGISGFTIDETGGGRPFHVRVVAPPEVAASGLEPLVGRIVEYERPAHATYEVDYSGRAAPQHRAAERTPEVPEPPATEDDGTVEPA